MGVTCCRDTKNSEDLGDFQMSMKSKQKTNLNVKSTKKQSEEDYAA